MPPTLEDIAIATGYDKSTVSVTLRNLPRAARFSSDTRRRIHAAAAKLGYRPNFFAQQLTGQKPRMLMLCVNYLRDPFAMMVAEGFQARAMEIGMQVLITALQDRQNPLDLHRDMIGVQGVPAVALVGGDSSKLSDAALVQLASEGVKIMLVNRAVESTTHSIGHVCADEVCGGRLAAEHVYAQGVSDVWLLGGMVGPAFEARIKGIRQVAAEHGKPEPRFISCLVPGTRDWAGNGATQVAAALAEENSKPPQAILTVSDALAVGAVRALSEFGLAVGRDVAVTGYDDGIYAQCAWPPMTTVRLPMQEMGRLAADGLMQMLETPNEPAPVVMLPVELIVRSSGRYAPASGSLAAGPVSIPDPKKER
jgi:LacI family transcriptional regulator